MTCSKKWRNLTNTKDNIIMIVEMMIFHRSLIYVSWIATIKHHYKNNILHKLIIYFKKIQISSQDLTRNCPYSFVDLLRIFSDIINDDVTFHHVLIQLLLAVILQTNTLHKLVTILSFVTPGKQTTLDWGSWSSWLRHTLTCQSTCLWCVNTIVNTPVDAPVIISC